MDTKELLKELTSVVAVAGKEENIVEKLKEILTPIGEVTTDSLNNVFCKVGSGDYSIMLDAHLDEIGLIVTSISDDGFLKVNKCGGVDPRMLLDYEVSVWGKEELSGVISTLPPHLLKDDAYKKVPDFSDIAIDIGMSKEDAEKIVSVGDRVTFMRNWSELLNNQISASVLDDRSGVASIILALERIKDKDLPFSVVAMFSSEEELGTRGAKVGPFGKNISESISVDVSFAYSPGCSDIECKIGEGAMIGIAPTLNNQITGDLIRVAKDKNINYQLEIMNGTTGTNADVISMCEGGIKTALISVPERYMHTPVEVVSIDDINSIADLISQYILDKAGDFCA